MATNITSLDRAVQNAVLWLNDIQIELGWDDRDIVYKASKAVLQAIRDRLPIEELFHFSSNLPMIFKGMLFDGYDTAERKKVKVKTVQEFYEQIQMHYGPADVDVISGQQAAFGVINVLFNRIGEGEMRKIADNMPLKLKPLFEHRVIPYTEEALTEISSPASS